MNAVLNLIRRALGVSTIMIAAMATSPATALPSWSYHWSDVDNQADCMVQAWEVVSRYEYGAHRPFVVDHTTESVIELEFADDDTVATLLCTPRMFVLYVFGPDYQVAKELRDAMGDLFENQ